MKFLECLLRVSYVIETPYTIPLRRINEKRCEFE
jgi:hypothetical protein